MNMRVVRTFVAVLIDENLKESISKVQNQVKKLAPDVKWVAPENVHVTCKFLGNVREDMLPQVFSAVCDAARQARPFELSVAGLDAFPNPARARVVWVGIENGREEMIELASAIDESLARLGFEREERPFKAHITIGRVKTSRFLGALAEGLHAIDASALGAQRVASVAVMQSELMPDGPVYTLLKVVELGDRDLEIPL